MRIAVIGGGAAGLAAAWLLQEDHEVTLLEKEDRLGGHANTVEVEIDGSAVPVESGFEFFIEEEYPYFVRLLHALGVPLGRYPMTFTLFSPGSDRVHLLPPVRSGRMQWSALQPRSLSYLLQFASVLQSATLLVENRDWSVTIGDFVQRCSISKAFRDQFLFPFLDGGWCVPIKEFRRLAAYDVLKYVLLHRVNVLTEPVFSEVPGGMRTYVSAMRNALSRTAVMTSAETRCIGRSRTGYVLAGETGEHKEFGLQEFDHLVFATNAAQARRLLTGVDGAGEHRTALGGFRYFKTSIAVHRDRRLMPAREKDWSVFNIRWDGQRSLSTIWRRQAGGNPVFRSWIANGNPPDDLYHLAAYWHPLTDPEHFRAQELLERSQGRRNLWFAGAYAQDIDSHESAILSAVRVARELAPGSANLKRLVRPLAGL